MNHRISTVMKPVSHQDWEFSLIPLRRVWPINRQWSEQAVGILYRIVTVVPCTAILSSLKFIRKVFAWCDWTLSDSWNTVHVHAAKLTNTVPVDSCAIERHVVDDFYTNRIAPALLHIRQV